MLAEELVPARPAAIAALIAAVVPVVFLTGAHAYPEPILQFLFLKLLILLVAGLKTGRRRWWILAGVTCALGLAYHYRFWMVPAGLALFALTTPQGRVLLKRPECWIAAGIAAIGLVPGVVHNVQTGFDSFRFQAAGRGDWAFWPPGLLFTLEQALILTPVIAVFVGAGVWRMIRRLRSGDAAAGVILFPCALIWLVFAVLAPLNKDYLLHWPFMAYAPVLPFAALEADRWMQSGRWRSAVLALGVAVAVAVSAGWAVNLVRWKHADLYDGPLYGGDLENWERLQEPLTRAVARLDEPQNAIVAASDHVTAAQIQIAADSPAPVYTLDAPVDQAQHFQDYWDKWGRGEADLPPGAPAVIALREPAYLYRDAAETAFRERLCGIFENVQELATIPLPPGKVRVSLYIARVSEEPGEGGVCPLLPNIIVEQPRAGRVTDTGVQPVYGMAAHPDGVARVEILIDGKVAARTERRIDLPGYRFPKILDYDPAYPAVYYDTRVDFSAFEPGAHTLGARLITETGQSIESSQRIIFLR